jgi:hypothetical protein
MPRCKNIRSRKHPDTQCQFQAPPGKEFCSRHQKNPRPFAAAPTPPATRRQTTAAILLQKIWRHRQARRRFSQQGPIACCIELANNETELYTLEPVTAIPLPYRFTYCDQKGHFWAFDIRTLREYMAKGARVKNPYTCDEFPETTMQALNKRVKYLLEKKWALSHVTEDALTPDQLWRQHVLDVFLTIEGLGYLVNCEWFLELSVLDHREFYKFFYNLWHYRLQITQAERDKILPGWRRADRNPFTMRPDEIQILTVGKPQKWWRKRNLHVIQVFVTAAAEKERRSLGALYSLMSLVAVSEAAAEAFPWLVAAA